MILHDYQCKSCQHVRRDIMWQTNSDVKRFIVCPKCAGHMEILYRSVKGGGVWNRPYSNKWLGTTPVESYAHKRVLLARLGLEDAGDANRGSRDPAYPDGFDPDTCTADESASYDPTKLDSHVLAATSLEDLEKQIETQYDRIGYELSQGKEYGRDETVEGQGSVR